MRVSQRGKFRTLVHDDGSAVVASVDAPLLADPAPRNGKTYAHIPVKDPIFRKVDVEIRRAQPDLAFSPLLQNKLFVKFGSGPGTLVDSALRAGDTAHFELRLGNFGSFGYCWIATTAYKT